MTCVACTLVGDATGSSCTGALCTPCREHVQQSGVAAHAEAAGGCSAAATSKCQLQGSASVVAGASFHPQHPVVQPVGACLQAAKATPLQ
jgi:hypothetical protein